uniref:Integrin alpha FG-GAP repeat containing 2 n=1 Tax=Paramormyrops kingsleyae TaxID=1676925 RepID=A0A3B3R5Y8_9TELE
MRSVSYVQRVSLDFSGTLFPHAICLGDADNDSLTCVGVGDICNRGKNFVIAVGAEGWLHLFDLSAAAKSESSSQQEALFFDDQTPYFTQHIPANTKVILISDIDGDGRNELVLGYTDRVVRAFRWEEPPDAPELENGQLVLLKKWLLEGQVDSLSVNPGPEGLPELMVSQPGCGYAILLCSWTQESPADPDCSASSSPEGDGPSRDVILHLTSGRIHNKNVSTHLIGSIGQGSSSEPSKCGLFALCTLDGTLKLMDSTEQLLWSVQVDHQLFALQKLDVTGDGREEVVACAWDGQTYIIDHNRAVVRFQFDENVSAFCAGLYACKEGKNTPCLVYVSFSHKIYVYWSVGLERMESTNLLKVLEEQTEYHELLRRQGVDPEDTESVRALIQDVLYGEKHPAPP